MPEEDLKQLKEVEQLYLNDLRLRMLRILNHL